ncbi:hypothetical protein [Microbispora bryophytorum]|uniref:Uncharacterized protein n=1 Tax=Microbispora bryophytorum TaxID=1460882 RepID=A0A8H9H9D7_9ACTN|nr:hypothetical protein [Microbispora bryophytorum]MBD3139858.1 hypothetical protein [Microbispora bryophytorum]TQS02603.1 hypothetical protein FLX07_27120 [Microbispora bryophytorum]GGO26929.1 hypothetical protein GCM10011574_59870 [Microbispora bryophytorum]
MILITLDSRIFGDSADRLLALAAERGVSRVVVPSAIIDDPFDLQPSRWRGDRNREAGEAAVRHGRTPAGWPATSPPSGTDELRCRHDPALVLCATR